MDHFTQLGLSGKTSPYQSPEGQRLHPKKLTGKQRTITLIGSLIATALLGVFLLESGCSKELNKTATIAPPTASQPSPSISTTPAPTSAPVPIQPPAKKKSRQRKLAASTYSSPTYGVSFRYPKYGNLSEGDEANLELDGLGPLEMNFVEPGGTTISAIELPRKLYAGTDFNAAFFNVSVNSELTSDECGQFAFPETGNPETDPVTTSKTKVGATEFHAVEGFAEGENAQADVKYYHVFQNGSCYEFVLGLETAEQAIPDEIKPAVKPVDRNEVFRQLNWILSTVKIQPVELPRKAVPEVAAGNATVPAGTTITEAH
jgi:hypothetical protein